MARVLVTHADEPIGRRTVKTLFHDERVDHVLAVGHGPPPRAFDRFLGGDDARVEYARVDLAKHRPVSDLFHSSRFRSAEIDTVVHIPRHGATASESAPLVAGLPERTAETRLLIQHCLEATTVRSLVAVGSAFVYKLPPGNVNRLDEGSELDLDPDVPSDIRSWIDCDMILHGEVHNDRLRVVLLRVPTVVASGGYVYFHPSLARPGPTQVGPHLRCMGFDPICALVSDKDVARAIRASVFARRSGTYNIAGRESVPLSVLAHWVGRPIIPVPGPLLSVTSLGTRLLGREAQGAGSGRHLRYGFTLDTRRAERELDFRPTDHIGLARAGDGALRLETVST
jgi:nucleoside-diphosphate-sugar epimerase